MSEEDVKAQEELDKKNAEPMSILKDGFWTWFWWQLTQKGRKTGDE